MEEHEVEGECPWKADLFSATLISIALLQAVCVQKHTGDFTPGPPASLLTYRRWLRKQAQLVKKKKNVSVNEGKHLLVTESRHVLMAESITFTAAMWRGCRALPTVVMIRMRKTLALAVAAAAKPREEHEQPSLITGGKDVFLTGTDCE